MQEGERAEPPRPRASLPTCASFDSSHLRASPLPRLRSSASESRSAGPPLSRLPADAPPSGPYIQEGGYIQGPGAYLGASLQGPATGVDSLPRRRAWHSGSSQWSNAALGAPGGQDGTGASGPWCGGGPPAPGRPRSEETSRGSAGDGAPVKRKAWSSDGAESQ